MSGPARLVRREASGDLPLLVCLAVLVGVLTALSAWLPPLVSGRQDAALRQRVQAAQRTAPLFTVATTLSPPAFGELPPPQSVAAALRLTGPQLIAEADPVLRRDLGYVRSEADFTLGRLMPMPPAPDPRIRTSVAQLSYVSDASAHVRIVAGAFPAAVTPTRAPTPLAVSQATARLLGLHVGEGFTMRYGDSDYYADSAFTVSGVYVPLQTGDSFWNDHAALDQPLQYPDADTGGDQVSFQGLLGADAPEHLARDGVLPYPSVSWQFKVTPGRDAVAQEQRLTDALAAYGTELQAAQCPSMSGDDTGEPACTAGYWPVQRYTWTDGLTPLLASFDQERQEADEVQSFALASVAGVLLATASVAVRLLLRRRDGHLRLQRARGASTSRLVLLRSAVATPVLLAAGVIGWALGVHYAARGSSGVPQAGWAAASAALAWALLPLLTWLAVREPGVPRRRVRRGRRFAGRREVLELTALLLAVAGVVALRLRGATPVQGVDLEMSAVPVLVGLAGVLVLLRIYPPVLALLSRQARRGRGALAFVGLARAGRDATATGLALFVLVLTVATAVFGGMVARTVTDGVAVGVAWTTGGDAVALAAGNQTPTPTPASSPVIAVGEQSRSLSLTASRDGASVTGVLTVTVDAARLAAAEPGSPLARALLSKASSAPVRRADGTVELPVLGDRTLFAAESGGDLSAASFANTDRTHQVRLRMTGALTTAELHDPALGPLTAAVPPGTPLLIGGAAAQAQLAPQTAGGTAVLLYAEHGGPPVGADTLRGAAVAALGPLAEVRLRSDALASMRADGLTSELRQVYGLSTVLTALFGLLAVALELALTARERGRTSSYLRTLGLGGRPAAALQVLQLVPFGCAAALGGVLLGMLEPRLLGPALNLRQFTGGPARPALHTDYRLTVALGLGMALLVLAAAAAEALVARVRRLGAVLRLGEV
ncbi:hypothetical protein [Streptacidiphilus cavernicola]|uniref:ABC transporter permease n=1 Tax=Streptacidiphilus cavernicola TaxID=3342716 RepID=A0ABV6W3P2_9ACTN